MKFSIRRNGRRAAAILLAVMLLITALPLTVSAAEPTAQTTAAVHLRSGKGTSYSSQGVVAQGTTLTVTDTSDKEWYGVALSNGKTGYIFAEYLSVNQAGAGTEIAAKTNECVRLRSGPGTGYASLLTLQQGASVTVTDTSNSEWYAVRTSSGKTGYIFAIYLDLGDAAQKPSATATPMPTATPKPSATAAPSAAQQKAKTTAPLHLRSGAGTTYKSLGVIASGTTVTVLEKSNSAWYKVETSGGKTGYMFAEYLQLVETSASGTESVEAKTTTYVRLRSGPGTSYYSKGTIATDTKLTVTDRSNKDWYAVKLSDGRTGYIYAIYLKITETATPKPTATAKPTATPKPTAAPSAAPESGAVIVKTTAALNLRKGPSTSDSRIQVVAQGTEVTVLAIASDPKWYRVRLKDGTEGYFSTEYLKLVSGNPDTLEPEKTEEPEEGEKTEEEKPDEPSYVRTTASGLNFRTGPGTNYSKISVLSSGTVLTVLAVTDNGWIKGETASGTVGYVSAEYVSEYDPSSASAELPADSMTLPRYKTLYLSASTSGTVYWSSSNTSVATVSSNAGSQVLVYGVKEGTVTITGKNASGKVLTSMTVFVTAPEAVRFAYTNPNMIQTGAAFDWIVITDSGKDEVKIEVDGLDTTYTLGTYTTESENGNTVRIFSGKATFNKAGTYTARVYSRAKGGSWSKDYKEITVCVSGTGDRTETTSETRRISTEMMELVASYEGYRSTVYADTLATGNIPTVGYGYVVSKNTSFYNSLTKSEAMAMLAYTLNTRTYTSEVNKFIQNNNMKMSQQQFDAMVSFSYNIGAGYWNSLSKPCYVRTVLLNTVALTDASSSNPYSAAASSSLSVYKEHSASSGVVKSVAQGGSLSVIGFYKNDATAEAWYKVSVGGVTGWARSGNISLNNASGLVRDLAYVDGFTFGSNLLEWHKAGSSDPEKATCYPGLYYRRLGEAKIFCFGDYAEASKTNSNYKNNTYGFDLPDCV